MHSTRRVAIAIQIDRPFPHHQQVLVGVQRFAREKRSWQCVIDEHPGYAISDQHEAPPYDGVIARGFPPLQERLKRQGVPLVNVLYQAHSKGVAGVYADPFRNGQIAAEHLIDRGFKRLLVVFEKQHQHSRLTAKAFADRSDELGVACRVLELNERQMSDPDQWLMVKKDIFDIFDTVTPPTGVFVRSAHFARMMVQYARDYGLHVPHDLAVICHYNVDAIVNVPPQISAIDANFERVGYEAAALLEQMMDGRAVPDQPVFVPPIGVVGRETTDYFAVEDPLVGRALRYVAPRLHEKLRVDDIAYALNVSPRLLQLRFAQAMGMGLSDEIRRLRFEKAKRLLAEPDRQIGSIPKKVGFATLYVMNQVFKRQVGLSPSAYRQKVLGQDNKHRRGQGEGSIA